MKTSLKLAMCLCVLMTGCANKEDYKSKLFVKTTTSPELSFDRYEDVLFQIDTARFQETVQSIQQDYLPFLAGDLSDPNAILYLKAFAVDTFSITLYHEVKKVYPDLKGVQSQIESVYQMFNYYYPDIQLPKKVFTCVSGVNPDIPPVMMTDDALILSLDWYLDRSEVYDYVGMPKYRVERTAGNYIGRDVAELFYETFLADRHKQTTVLDEMIREGKKRFFVEAMCPSLPDQVLLGYSLEQLQWASANEGNLWADIVGNQRLYSSEYDMFRTFFADGPFTNEYSHEAPARLGEFLGLHIVRSYMNTHELSVPELMRLEDLQTLFQESGYKPRK